MRSTLRWFLNWLAKRKIFRINGVSISPNTKVNYRGIVGKRLSSLIIKDGSIVEGNIIIDKDGASVSIGHNTFIGRSNIVCAEKVEIGDDVLISWGCYIVDHNSHPISWSNRREDVKNWFAGTKIWDKVVTKKIVIGSRSWIGFNVIILKGVVIGEGAIVGAGSVVTKDVPPNTIVAGNPARVIREMPENV